MQNTKRPHKKLAITTVSLVALMAVSACSPNSDKSPDSRGTVITCGTCQASPTDPFLQYNFEAAQRFNEANKGKYFVETLQNAHAGSSPDRLQYYQRLALANDLPDLFQLNSAEIHAMAPTGKIHDFASDLSSNAKWSASFQEQVFDALSGDKGQRWAIPQQRDPIGIYFNTKVLSSVGYDKFPATWDDFETMAAKLKDAGKVAMALDGDWATMLTWTNLIGTQAGGVYFLTNEIGAGGDFGRNTAVVKATERLKKWQEKGYINSDSFSGDFQNAAAAYLSGQAASVANGPWFVKTNLKSSSAMPGLYDSTGYAVSPGWDKGQGLIVVSGAGWVSGSKDESKLEAVDAFLQFITSSDEVLKQAKATGANPAVKVAAADLKAADLERLSSSLVAAAEDEKVTTYPHVRVHGPAGFGNAWKNLWPAYVKGEMDTPKFLTRLSQDSKAGAK